jgi:hypothetical protein
MPNPALVQANFNNGSGTTVAAVFTGAQTAGNCNVIGVFADKFPTQVIDTKGNIYTPVIQPFGVFKAAPTYVEMYVAENIAAAASSGNTVTMTFNGSTTFCDIEILEYSNVAGFHPCIQIAPTGQGNGTTATSGSLTTIVPNELVVSFAVASGAGNPVAGGGFTKRTADTFNAALGDQVVASAGSVITGTWTVASGLWYCATIGLLPTAAVPAATGGGIGEVMYYGPLSHDASLTKQNYSPDCILDGNSFSAWTALGASGDWIGMDCGAAVQITRVRMSAVPGYEDDLIGGQIQASVSDPAFAAPVTLFTFPTARVLDGSLVNEYLLNPSGAAYRYYRYLAPNSAAGIISDIDFIGLCATGAIARCVSPVISPPGIQNDKPTVVSISSLTTGAAIYYTTDGTDPTTASTLYSGPFVISANTTIKAVAALANLLPSRITTSKFYCNPSSFVVVDDIFDNRNYKMWSIDGQTLQDPFTGYWYRYGTTYDQPTVVSQGAMGLNIYKSADLRNWIYVGKALGPPAGLALGTQLYYAGRCSALYNALNRNFVLWASVNTGAGQNWRNCYTSPSPEGPWNLVGRYPTMNGFATDDGTNSTDSSLFQDTDGTAYHLAQVSNAGTPTLLISRLNSAYTAVDGVNFASYGDVAIFGAQVEAPAMFKRGSIYFLVYSGQTQWEPNQINYATATNPIGTWTIVGNPFANVAVTQSPEEAVAGDVPAYTNGYDSQVNKILQVPGRGDCQIYMGDRYSVGLQTTVGTSLASNFAKYRRIMLPVTFPTPTTMSISWVNSWNLDSVFPSISGAPWPPNYLSVIQGIARWINYDPAAHVLYLDSATDQGFTQNVRSEMIGSGSSRTLQNAYTVIMPQTAGWYRLRAVNASGTSLSLPVAGTNTGNILATFKPSKARKRYNMELLKDEESKEQNIHELV